MTDPEAAPELTPFERFGGEVPVRELVERFYDLMDEREPALAALHEREDDKVSRASRDRFALFLIGWLGGPQTYMERHGHPRLRMRHARVPVTSAMRDAWLRCMHLALDERALPEDLGAFLHQRFADVADFLKNQPEW
jgi:hemoglobin